MNNQLALHNTALLRSYMEARPSPRSARAPPDLPQSPSPLRPLPTLFRQAFPPCRPLCLLVKAWAKQRQLNSAAHGTLSSYAHVLSVVHFLQAG